ncbi:hypothetical protein EYZ11_004656 [Aspergillus tanneri]|uniref:Uncharacterized protein n=1 Tax=Aspergillus tanneri TaxID=1220188 RepID=A0A4S3JMC0_9EURO|nr:hypothetical protein EYZ11_004656 [Aspergillus tanneri]
MVAAKTLLYKPGEHPDRTVVIKYLPAVGETSAHLMSITTISSWANIRQSVSSTALSLLSYMLNEPMTPPGVLVVNALGKQRTALTNYFRLIIGLEPESEVVLE